MASSAVCPADHPGTQGPPGPAVVVTGVLMTLWCLGFAAVNIGFQVTDHFADGPYAEYASAITVMNWLVVGLKLLGAAVALLAVGKRRRFVSPALVTAAVWGAFATLGVYALGSVAEAVGMAAGLSGGVAQIDGRGVAYVVFFLAAALGYGVLAVSYSRRHRRGPRPVLLGVLGAPVVLALLLLGVPALLTALGVMPAA